MGPSTFNLTLQSTAPFHWQEFCEFRAKCGLLWCYDWVSIPMVYTQVPVVPMVYTQVPMVPMVYTQVSLVSVVYTQVSLVSIPWSILSFK